jgi:hypothetical protein
MTRPGGYVAVLTSRYTLDAVGTTARAAMAEAADLIGALRLPDGAMQRIAGTEAAMDVLVLRRRLPGAGPAGESWLGVTEVDTPDGQVRLNEVFAAHPDWVLGEVGIGRGRYADDELVIRPRTTVVDGREGREPLGPVMNAALARMIDQGLTAGLAITERVSAPEANVATAEAEWVGDVTIGPHHVEAPCSCASGEGSPASRAECRSPMRHPPPRAASWSA